MGKLKASHLIVTRTTHITIKSQYRAAMTVHTVVITQARIAIAQAPVAVTQVAEVAINPISAVIKHKTRNIKVCCGFLMGADN